MGLKNLSDDELAKMLADPKEFIKDGEMQKKLMDIDSDLEARTFNVLKAQGLSDEQIRTKIDEVMAVRLKDIDVWL
ncbi:MULTISPECIES: hypothetical protein [unclassified Phaeobacter]|uniref:hypothetical protein n=1 Tax=unclassified Phaeobacter TaxID=2621772 RepID=UPI003A891250